MIATTTINRPPQPLLAWENVTSTVNSVAFTNRVEADPDRADMQRLVNGDASAMERLMARHVKSLRRHIRNLVNESSVVDDILQDTFQRVYTARHSYEPRFAFATWLYTIARHRAFDYRKRAERTARHFVSLEDASEELESVADHCSNPFESLASADYWTMIAEIAEQLPYPLREALALCAEDECSHEALAHKLNCSIKALESRLYRARAALRSELQAREDKEGQPRVTNFANGGCHFHRIAHHGLHASTAKEEKFFLKTSARDANGHGVFTSTCHNDTNQT